MDFGLCSPTCIFRAEIFWAYETHSNSFKAAAATHMWSYVILRLTDVSYCNASMQLGHICPQHYKLAKFVADLISIDLSSSPNPSVVALAETCSLLVTPIVLACAALCCAVVFDACSWAIPAPSTTTQQSLLLT